MCIFYQVILDPPYLRTLRYIPDIINCYSKYAYFLNDDFSGYSPYSFIQKNSPFLWVITDISEKFMGFVSLDNFTGNVGKNYSAEITTCFDKRAWGNFTCYSAKFFLKKAFDEFGLEKIKALIYPDNFRVKTLLKRSGFKYESTLKNETVRAGRFQDVEVYAIYKNYYYKNEVNYE